MNKNLIQYFKYKIYPTCPDSSDSDAFTIIACSTGFSFLIELSTPYSSIPYSSLGFLD